MTKWSLLFFQNVQQATEHFLRLFVGGFTGVVAVVLSEDFRGGQQLSELLNAFGKRVARLATRSMGSVGELATSINIVGYQLCRAQLALASTQR